MKSFSLIKAIIEEYEKGSYAKDILKESVNNYNNLYHENLNINAYSKLISEYAGKEDAYGNIIYDEVIAEAVHDYYIHGDNMEKASNEIIKVLKGKLGI